MNASRAAAMVVGVNLIAVWAVAAVGTKLAAPPPVSSARAAAEEDVGRAQVQLVEATERLRARQQQGAGRLAIVRDPFRFTGERRGAATPATAPAGATEPEPGTDPPAEVPAADIQAAGDLVLVGMAESHQGDATVRTAVIRAGSDIVLAGVGAFVTGRFTVVALTADSADLDDTQGGPRRTLRLK